MIAGPHGQRVLNALGGVAPNRSPTSPAVQDRGAGEQQLQVIVELRHGADGRARGPHGVGLIDGYRRRNAVDAIDLRLVHPVQNCRAYGENVST